MIDQNDEARSVVAAPDDVRRRLIARERRISRGGIVLVAATWIVGLIVVAWAIIQARGR